jgi:hypothetical protein
MMRVTMKALGMKTKSAIIAMIQKRKKKVCMDIYTKLCICMYEFMDFCMYICVHKSTCIFDSYLVMRMKSAIIAMILKRKRKLKKRIIYGHLCIHIYLELCIHVYFYKHI